FPARRPSRWASARVFTLTCEMSEQGAIPTPEQTAIPVPEQAVAQPPGQTAIPTPPEWVALRDLEDGQRVRGVYAVRERELRRKRSGEPWLGLSVGDSSGTAEAVCWEDAEARFALCAPGSPVFVTGAFEVSERWGAKIKIAELREAGPHEYEPDD